MEKMFMNPNTGSVDTLDGWNLDTISQAKAEGLVEVGQDDSGVWVEQSDNAVVVNGKAYCYEKQYYNANLLNLWKPTSDEGADFSNRVLPNNESGYELVEMGEIEGHLAIMSYIVSDEELNACEDDLGNIDWQGAKTSIKFI